MYVRGGGSPLCLYIADSIEICVIAVTLLLSLVKYCLAMPASCMKSTCC